MKKLLLTILSAALFAKPVAAAPYVSGSIGLASLTNSDTTYRSVTSKNMIAYKSGIPCGAAIGVQSDAYRIEGALGYQSHDVDSVKRGGVPTAISGHTLSSLSYMINGYYDIDIKSYAPLSPYLTAGIGGATITERGVNTSDESSSGFAWQLGGGIGVKVSEHAIIDMGYRFFKPSAYNANGATDITALSHNFLAGVRYNF